MFSMRFDWKKDEQGQDWKVHLPSLEAWLRSEFPTYVGNAADVDLRLHFSEEPDSESKELIELHWEELEAASELAKFDHDVALAAAQADALAAIPALAWDDMIPAERKLVMKQSLSDADKEALLVKYPQA